MADANKFWFSAMKYGLGWGPPFTWQGKLVIAAFTLLMIAGFSIFPPPQETFQLIVYIAVIVVVFGAILVLKGEPLKWRWGSDKG